MTMDIGEFTLMLDMAGVPQAINAAKGGSGIFDPRLVWVSAQVGADANAGTIGAPKKTIAAALAVAAAPSAIQLTPGAYAENLTISKQNAQITGIGINQNASVEITGSVTAAVARLKLKDLTLNHGASTGVTWQAATGHQLENVAFVGTGGAASVLAQATMSGFAAVRDCDFTGTVAPANIVLNNLASGTASLSLMFCQMPRVQIGTGWTVYIYGCPTVQIVSNAGTVLWGEISTPLLNGLLTTEAQLTALRADTSAATDGYYAINYTGSATGPRGTIVYKISVNGVATSVLAHRYPPFNPATIWVAAANATYKFTSASGYAAA